MRRKITVAAREGTAFRLKKGQRLKVIDLEGGQVADLLAFKLSDTNEKLSTSVTIDNNGSLFLKKGDFLYSNNYNPLMCIIEDSVGSHNLLHPPCSPAMYRSQYNIKGEHPSCQTNFAKALRKYGIAEKEITTPFNIFMHTEVNSDGRVVVKEPLSKAGDYITLEAEVDLVVAVTACSVEESACNSYQCTDIGLVISQGDDK